MKQRSRNPPAGGLSCCPRGQALEKGCRRKLGLFQDPDAFQLGVTNCQGEGFPGCSVVKNPPAKARDSGSIPGLGRSPGEENGNPLQYSCLENPTDRETWQALVPGVKEQLDMT